MNKNNSGIGLQIQRMNELERLNKLNQVLYFPNPSQSVDNSKTNTFSSLNNTCLLNRKVQNKILLEPIENTLDIYYPPHTGKDFPIKEATRASTTTMKRYDSNNKLQNKTQNNFSNNKLNHSTTQDFRKPKPSSSKPAPTNCYKNKNKQKSKPLNSISLISQNSLSQINQMDSPMTQISENHSSVNSKYQNNLPKHKFTLDQEDLSESSLCTDPLFKLIKEMNEKNNQNTKPAFSRSLLQGNGTNNKNECSLSHVSQKDSSPKNESQPTPSTQKEKLNTPFPLNISESTSYSNHALNNNRIRHPTFTTSLFPCVRDPRHRHAHFHQSFPHVEVNCMYYDTKKEQLIQKYLKRKMRDPSLLLLIFNRPLTQPESTDIELNHFINRVIYSSYFKRLRKIQYWWKQIIQTRLKARHTILSFLKLLSLKRRLFTSLKLTLHKLSIRRALSFYLKKQRLSKHLSSLSPLSLYSSHLSPILKIQAFFRAFLSRTRTHLSPINIHKQYHTSHTTRILSHFTIKHTSNIITSFSQNHSLIATLLLSSSFFSINQYLMYCKSHVNHALSQYIVLLKEQLRATFEYCDWRRELRKDGSERYVNREEGISVHVSQDPFLFCVRYNTKHVVKYASGVYDNFSNSYKQAGMFVRWRLWEILEHNARCRKRTNIYLIH